MLNPSTRPQTMKSKPDKDLIIKGFIQKFEAELAALIQSAKAAHTAATHEESKAEDRHDTFAIEASYLAAGQATRVAELEKTLQEFEGFLTGGISHTQIALGSLITYQLDDKTFHAFVSSLGGGSKIQIDSTTIQTLSLQSPLGEALEGSKVDEEIEFEVRGSEKVYKIISIQ